MTVKLNLSFIKSLIIALLFVNNVLTLPELRASTTATTTDAIAPTAVFEHFTSNVFDKDYNTFSIFKGDEDEDDHLKSVREKKKEMRKNRFDNKSGRKYSKHENSADGDSDSDDDDDGDDDKKKRKPTASNTVVTTIIIVATEAPTSIYSGTTNPAKQKGTGDTGHQVNDPNYSSESNDKDEPSETALTDQLYKDQSSYHKLVLALSIVGSIAGVALLTGGLIFARMKIRKRKRKQADLEEADSGNGNTPISPSSPASPPSPPNHYSPPVALPKTRYSSMSDDGDSTVIEFGQNPFMDPSTTSVGNKDIEDGNTVTTIPNVPPRLPVHLDSRRYSDFRQNRTLSMISQTAGTTLPSAPTAKELDGIPRYENPFEDEYGSNQLYAVNGICDSPKSSPTMRTLPPPQPSQTSSFSSDLPPPPAYTPSATPNAAPSAPPLYALPTSRAFNTTQQVEDDSSRRHSISSCSMISTNRPISLRRGSGSPAHISSPFS
ncbi:unnamed protein product [Mucor hiemalis]